MVLKFTIVTYKITTPTTMKVPTTLHHCSKFLFFWSSFPLLPPQLGNSVSSVRGFSLFNTVFFYFDSIPQITEIIWYLSFDLL